MTSLPVGMPGRSVSAVLLLCLILWPAGALRADDDRQSCAETVVSEAAVLAAIQTDVVRTKLNWRQRILFAIRPAKIRTMITEELHRRGLTPGVSPAPAVREAVETAYDRAWLALKMDASRFLNGTKLTALGAGIFYLGSKGLSYVLPPEQAQAGAFFLGVVGAPLVSALSASLMEVVGSRLRRTSFSMNEFKTDVVTGAKERLQNIYYYVNASIAGTEQAGRATNSDADTNFAGKIQWATENLMRFLETGLEMRRETAATEVAMALIKLRENYPDQVQAMLNGFGDDLLREPRRLLSGLVADARIGLDRFYEDVLKVIRTDDPQSGNPVVAKAFEALLTAMLTPPPDISARLRARRAAETATDHAPVGDSSADDTELEDRPEVIDAPASPAERPSDVSAAVMP